MLVARIFVDSNVVVYSLGDDQTKKIIATTLLACSPILSTQVLIETANVARRKLGYSIAQIRSIIGMLRSGSEVRVISESVIDRSFGIAERYGFSTYDSLIVASALDASCEVLYSEDLQTGQRFDDQLTVVNPFLAA